MNKIEAVSPPAERPSFAEATRTFARIGLLSFGGPAGQIALMHRILIDEKRWIDEARFLHALNYCMLLPGPEATQLATYVGWLMYGVRGGLMAGLLFVLPGAAVLLALSTIYLLAGELTMVQGLLFGLKAAVLAVVLEALVKVSRRALKNGWMVALANAAFVAIAFLGKPFPEIIHAAAVLGGAGHLFAAQDQQGGKEAPVAEPTMPAGDWTQPNAARLLRTTLVWMAIWLGPLALLYLTLGGDHVFTDEAEFFAIMATVTFGGAYAVLAYVAQQAVEVYGWLRPEEMLTGLGLAETTPGPLILVLVFVGYLGGARLSGLEPVTGGMIGGLVALWFTFVPCFLWIFAGAPYVEKVRDVRWLATALAAVTAAVVGVIANLALWFGLHVLFGRLDEVVYGPFQFTTPDLGSIDWVSAAIAVAAAVALIRFHVNMIVVLVVAALAGMGWVLAG
jgi:chromate transporter